jgi:hypothetical protein
MWNASSANSASTTAARSPPGWQHSAEGPAGLPSPTPYASRHERLPPADAELFTESVTAAAADLAPITGIRLWGKAPACVCELRTARRVDDPLAGFVPPPTTGLQPDQGLWFTRQVCAYVDIRDIRAEGEGSTVRIQYA